MNYMSFSRSGKCFSVVLSALALSISLLLPASALAAVHLLAPSRTLDPALPLRLSLMLTAEEDSRDFSLPDVLRVSLTPDLGAPATTELRPEKPLAGPFKLGLGEFLRIDYVGEIPPGLRGRVRVDALDLDAPAMLVRLSTPRAGSEPDVAKAAGKDHQLLTGEVNSSALASFDAAGRRPAAEPNLQLDGRLSAFEPMFFAAGYGSDANAQVQLSFKLRLYEPVDKSSREFFHNMYFGYTQPAYWDLTSDSKPFVDTNYMPSFFYYIPDTDWLVDGNPVGIGAGYEHESNGRDGEDSRSLDVLFARPYFTFGDARDFHWTFSPKLYAYIENDENADIADYRGYADFHTSYGKPNDWQLASILRKGTSGDKGSVELQGTYPLHRWFPGVAGYFMVQAFSGYGEYLLNYNKREDLAVRLGYTIVR